MGIFYLISGALMLVLFSASQFLSWKEMIRLEKPDRIFGVPKIRLTFPAAFFQILGLAWILWGAALQANFFHYPDGFWGLALEGSFLLIPLVIYAALKEGRD